MGDQKILIIAIIGCCVTFILSAGVFIFFVITQRKKAQQLAEQSRHQQELLQTQIEIQQQTFQNVSREIHDNLGQVLSLIKLNLNSVSAATEQQPYHAKITSTLDLTSQVIRDLRHLSKGLNPDFVQQLGLTGCMEFELERLRNMGRFETQLQIAGDLHKMEFSKEFVIYRVVQECLNNIIKHAQASHINIDMNYAANQLTLCIADNGKGFDVDTVLSAAPVHTGSGLGNIQSRMAFVGGSSHFESVPGKGTVVRLQAPVG
jgi:two-component system, NarL family, sensor kinase